MIIGILKFITLKTKIRPRKLLRRLIKIYVVCFVSQEVKKYVKAYESLKAIAFRLTNVQSPFEINKLKH